MRTVTSCASGWHVRRDFLRLWTIDGSGRMYFCYQGRLRDEHGTYLYLVNDRPSAENARRVSCYEDQGVPWTCVECHQPVAAGGPTTDPRQAAASRGAPAFPWRVTVRPTVRAKTKRGKVRDDPSSGALVALVRGLDPASDRFLVVERLDRPEGEWYAQVLIDHDGTWVVEYRDGDGRHHFQSLTRDLDLVEAFLVGWLHGRPDFNAALEWHTLLS